MQKASQACNLLMDFCQQVCPLSRVSSEFSVLACQSALDCLHHFHVVFGGIMPLSVHQALQSGILNLSGEERPLIRARLYVGIFCACLPGGPECLGKVAVVDGENTCLRLQEAAKPQEDSALSFRPETSCFCSKAAVSSSDMKLRCFWMQWQQACTILTQSLWINAPPQRGYRL